MDEVSRGEEAHGSYVLEIGVLVRDGKALVEDGEALVVVSTQSPPSVVVLLAVAFPVTPP